MTKIGFIGLGIMGVPMVRNLVRAHMDVTIIDNGHGNHAAIAELKGQGVKVMATASGTGTDRSGWRLGRYLAGHDPHRFQLRLAG